MSYQKGHPSYQSQKSKDKTKVRMKGNKYRLGLAPWNKGKKGLQKSKFKGKHILWSEKSLKTAFKKGGIPWNKGKKYIQISGKNHHNWKGGITSLVEQIHKCFEYRQWRSDIFTRDDFTCQECWYSKGHILEAHHIKAFSKILDEYKIKTLEEALNCEELWNLNNGKTLCKECHKLTNNYGRPQSKK